MENYESNKTQRTVMGRFGRYEIEKIDGPGHIPWVKVTMTESNGAVYPEYYMPVEDIVTLSRALTEPECVHSDQGQDRRKRPFPEEIELLRGRNAGKAWGNGEEALLAYLFREGCPPSEIMTLLGRSHRSVTARLMQMGFIPEWAVPQYDYRLSMED